MSMQRIVKFRLFTKYKLENLDSIGITDSRKKKYFYKGIKNNAAKINKHYVYHFYINKNNNEINMKKPYEAPMDKPFSFGKKNSNKNTVHYFCFSKIKFSKKRENSLKYQLKNPKSCFRLKAIPIHIPFFFYTTDFRDKIYNKCLKDQKTILEKIFNKEKKQYTINGRVEYKHKFIYSEENLKKYWDILYFVNYDGIQGNYEKDAINYFLIDDSGNMTTIYLTDYLTYAEELHKNYINKHEAYNNWLNESVKISNGISTGTFKRIEVKSLTKAAQHLCSTGIKKFSSFTAHVLTYIIYAPTEMFRKITGYNLRNFIIPGRNKRLKDDYDFIYDSIKSHSVYYNKLQDADYIKLKELPEKCYLNNVFHKWKNMDYWVRKDTASEINHSIAINKEAQKLTEWINNNRFIAVQMDYEFGNEKEKQYQEERFGEKILQDISLSEYGKDYLTNLYNDTTSKLKKIRKILYSKNHSKIKKTIEKQTIKLKQNEKEDIFNFVYNQIGDTNWLGTRLISGARKVNKGFGYILKEISFLMKDEEDIYKLFNIPKEYLFPCQMDLRISHLVNSETIYYIPKWKEAITKNLMDEITADLKKRKNRTGKFIDPNKEYVIKFKKSSDGKKITAYIGEKVEKQSWYDAFTSKTAYKVFNSVLEGLNLIICTHKLITSKNKFTSGLELSKAITGILGGYAKSKYLKYTLEIGKTVNINKLELLIRSAKNYKNLGRGLTIVSGMIEAFLTGKKAYSNYLEKDNDALVCYIAAIFSGAALTVGALVASGPIGIGVCFFLFVVDYVIREYATLVDDDDYQIWLDYCLWGKKYPSKKIKSPKWADKRFYLWENNIETQLKSYANLINDYKVQITPVYYVQGYVTTCLINIRINPICTFRGSVFKITLIIDGKEFTKKLIFYGKHANAVKYIDSLGRKNIETGVYGEGNSKEFAFGLYAYFKLNKLGAKFNRDYKNTEKLYDCVKKNKIPKLAEMIGLNKNKNASYSNEKKKKFKIKIEYDIRGDGDFSERIYDAEFPIVKNKLAIFTSIPEKCFQHIFDAEEIINSKSKNILKKFLTKSDIKFIKSRYIKKVCNFSSSEKYAKSLSCQRSSICGLKNKNKSTLGCWRLKNVDDNNKQKFEPGLKRKNNRIRKILVIIGKQQAEYNRWSKWDGDYITGEVIR